MPGDGLRLENRQDVLLDRELTKYRSFLREIADAVLARPQIHRDVGNVVVVDQDSTGVRGDEAHDRVEGRSLTGSVRSKQTNDFALLDAQADPVYNAAVAIGFADFIGG